MSNEKNKIQDQEKLRHQNEEPDQTNKHQNIPERQDSDDLNNGSLSSGRITSIGHSADSSKKSNVTGSDLDGQTNF